jgi:hypothetical protein
MTAVLTVAKKPGRICRRCEDPIPVGDPIVFCESRRGRTVAARSYVAKFYHPEHYLSARGEQLLP